mmetsp:Transcript_22923/g.46845  ORF Transcript_22923/g.46845 Transcript_22923/m.46845 type:complete len:230 (-) Transcript_22923:74-763(-)
MLVLIGEPRELQLRPAAQDLQDRGNSERSRGLVWYGVCEALCGLAAHRVSAAEHCGGGAGGVGEPNEELSGDVGRGVPAELPGVGGAVEEPAGAEPGEALHLRPRPPAPPLRPPAGPAPAVVAWLVADVGEWGAVSAALHPPDAEPARRRAQSVVALHRGHAAAGALGVVGDASAEPGEQRAERGGGGEERAPQAHSHCQRQRQAQFQPVEALQSRHPSRPRPHTGHAQ